MPTASRAGDRAAEGSMGGGRSNAGSDGGKSGGGGNSRNNVSGGMSAASHKGDTVSGGGHGAYAGGFTSPSGYNNVTGQERMARIGDRTASASMSGFSNGTSSGAAPTGSGGGIGPGQGNSGMRAAQIGKDAFAARQAAATARAAPTAGRISSTPPRLSPPPAPPPVIMRPPTIAPPVTVSPIAPPVAAPPSVAPPSVSITMRDTFAPPSVSAPPSVAAPPSVSIAMRDTVAPPSTSAPPAKDQSRVPSGPRPGDIGYIGGVTSAERGLMAGKSIGTPGSQAGYAVGRDSPPSNPARGSVGAAPGLPGSAGDTGTMGVPGGLQARGTGSPASRGVPGRPGAAPSSADAPARGSDPGVAGVPGGLAARGGLTGAPVAGPRSDPRDAGVMGIAGGLAARGTTQAQALAKSAMDSSWGQASPTMAANLMARAVKGQLGPAATAALAAAQSTGFSPGAMMAAVSATSPQANLNFTKGWQAQNMDPRVQEKMNELAKILGINDFSIVSGWRDRKYNARVGGKKKSQHMRGTAVDVAYPANVKTEADRQAFARAMRQAGFTGIGSYAGFVHGDLGPNRGWGDNRSRDAFAKGLVGGK
jgi:hypothetical protein